MINNNRLMLCFLTQNIEVNYIYVNYIYLKLLFMIPQIFQLYSIRNSTR